MNDLAGRSFLVTSGPTRAKIDAVRFISNSSTGRLGAVIATEALRRGARVLYVHGTGAHLPLGGRHGHLETLEITWVNDLYDTAVPALKRGRFDVIVHAMAILDYAPRSSANRKTPSGIPHWEITLEPMPKLLPLLRQWHPHSLIVGFKLQWAAPAEDLIGAARKLLKSNRLELVVANDLSLISGDSHPAVLLGDAGVLATATTKSELAQVLIAEISRRLRDEQPA
jgi:phosphopantothenoylcysteine synthetase/decarboxylase